MNLGMENVFYFEYFLVVIFITYFNYQFDLFFGHTHKIHMLLHPYKIW